MNECNLICADWTGVFDFKAKCIVTANFNNILFFRNVLWLKHIRVDRFSSSVSIPQKRLSFGHDNPFVSLLYRYKCPMT